jgi:hypothetical protein
MVPAWRQKVVVQPGGVIEIRSSELPVGAKADVIVMLESAGEPAPPMTSMIGTGQGGFATPEEADAFIRQERDAWQS